MCDLIVIYRELTDINAINRDLISESFDIISIPLSANYFKMNKDSY